MAAIPAPEPKAAPKVRKVATTKAKGPSELERIEAEIAAGEQTVAELERQLAEDWNDVETLARHRRARDELQALLQQWERLFERAHT